jgi:very-short-patch-repair endonuclease
VGWVARAREVHGDRFDYGEAVYLCSSEKVAITCRVHGAFWQNASNHLSGAGCPRCPRSLTSKGERAVARVLEAAGVVFEEQWSHPTLRLRRLLWVDFALVGQRVLVEFDGVQHSGPVRWPGTTWEVAQAAFADGQVRDAVKDAWAVANGWRMVRLTNVKTVEADLRAAGVIP